MLWLENKALSHRKLNTLVGWMPLSGDSLREKSETLQQHFCHAEAPGQLRMRKETLGPAGCTGLELEPGDAWEAMTSQAPLALQGELPSCSGEGWAEHLPGAPRLASSAWLPQTSSVFQFPYFILSMEVLSPINNFVTFFILSVNYRENLHIPEGLIV